MTSATRLGAGRPGAERPGTDGRVAVVTGGGSGIGAAAVKRLAQLGFGVVAVGRRREPLEEVAEAVADAGGLALAVPADLADPLSPAEVVSNVLDRFGRLDIIVNNAAVIRTGPGRRHAGVGRPPLRRERPWPITSRKSGSAGAARVPGRGHRQCQLLCRVHSEAREHAVRLDQSRPRVPDQGVGVRASRRRDPGQLHRSWPGRYADPRHVFDRSRSYLCRSCSPGPFAANGSRR